MNDAESIVELIPRLRRYARALAGDRVVWDSDVALGIVPNTTADETP